MKVEQMLSTEIPSSNPHILLHVAQDVLKHLNDKLPKSKDEISASNRAIVNNIKQMIVSMRAHGRLDGGQNLSMESIAFGETCL